VKAGAVHSIKELVLEVPMNVQSEMTACVAVLALSGTPARRFRQGALPNDPYRRTKGPAPRDGNMRGPDSSH
jgi:hypothetical protein